MCDPYMHIEEELRLTRSCLELIERYGFGLAILTKSARILRDLDLLTAINKKTKCVVQITLTTYDEALCRLIEPDVSTTAERVEALKAINAAGIPTVVWMTPTLPFINDSEENLRGLLDCCTEARVKGIICFGFGVTLREGDREYFYKKLDEHFPGVKQKYIKTYGNSYECQSPNSAALHSIFREECKRRGIMHRASDIFSYMGKFESENEQLTLF